MLEIDINDKNFKDRSYLKMIKVMESLSLADEILFKVTKEVALKDLQTDLAKIKNDFDAIYSLFLLIKNADRGILRYRRLHFFSNEYGDTDSYRQAMQMICFTVSKATGDLNEDGTLRDDAELKTYHDYEKKKAIYAEAVKVGIYDNHQYRNYISKIKPKVLDLFKQAIEQQQTLSAVLRYYALVQKPDSILRVHTENWFKAHGDTHSYLQALCVIAKKAIAFDKYDNDLEQPDLIKLHNELKRYKTSFDYPLQHTIDNLENFIYGKVSNNLSSDKQQTRSRGNSH